MRRTAKNLLSLLPAILVVMAAAVLFQSCTGHTASASGEMSAATSPETAVKPKPLNTLYGIPVDSFMITSGKVHRGQALSDILVPHGVSPLQVYKISMLPDSVLNERKIRPGFKYTFFSTKDSLPAAFVYEKDPLNYVVVRFLDDSVAAFNGSKQVKRQVRTAAGTIESSLWQSMLDADTDPMLAVELSEIFAWSIDFFGIQSGDRYKVIYEESFVDSSSLGPGRILGAWFCHSGTEFWAIPFEQDGVRSFFDEQGNSLRKAFLKAPLRYSRISSGFSHSRYHPVLKIRRPHHGVDYAAPAGTPVVSVGDGFVTRVGYQRGGGGNYVKIKHNSVYSTTYMHLSRFGKGIKSGVFVHQGDVIGYVGSTGLATGPHLDFRFYRNGSAVNPLKVEAPPVEPVFQDNLQAYGFRKKLVMGALKLI